MKETRKFSRLFGKKPSTTGSAVLEIPVDDILANTSQPRTDFPVESLIRLADSIRRYGILQPLTVRRKSDGAYELIAGERRLRAARMLGLKSVPCIVRETSDSDSAEFALIENTIREDLDMFETATAYGALSAKFHLTQEQIAERMSLSQSAVANKMRLLRFSDEERELISSAGLTERHARAILRLQSKTTRQSALQYVINHGLNVTQTEEYVSSLLSGKPLPDTAKASASSRTPLAVCKAVGKYMAKLQESCGFVDVQTSEDDAETVITLRIKNSDAS